MRKCLQCRQEFDPSTKFMFRCDPCKSTEKRAEEYHLYGYLSEKPKEEYVTIEPQRFRTPIRAIANGNAGVAGKCDSSCD